MKPYHKEQPEKIRVGKLKRDPWTCHPKGKGIHHRFQLTPPSWPVDLCGVDPLEYYKDVTDEDNGRIFSRIRYWECVKCEKKAWDSEGNPDKRIRNHLN